MTGFVERWRQNAHRYADDIILFGEDQWAVRDAPPGMELGPDNTIRFLPHQKEILRGGEYEALGLAKERYPAFFDRDSTGDLCYDLMIYSTIKKSGKTEIEAVVAEHTAVTSGGTPEVYFVGNDKEQAQTRAFAAIGAQINPKSKVYNEAIASQFVIPSRFTPSLALIPMQAGGFLKSIPIDYAGEAGSAPKASVWDELWGADRESQRRLWAEMTPPPTVRSAFRFVATYAGYLNESELLWDLFKRVVGEKPHEQKKRRVHPTLPIYVSPDGNAIAYWDTGENARRMPWQQGDYGKRYYAREKATYANRPSDYNRLHLNLWQNAAEAFIDAEKWDALPKYARGVDLNPERYPEYITIDAAHKRDTCYAVDLAYTGQKTPSGRPILKIIDVACWRPSKGNVVVPEETAVPWVKNRIANGNVKAVGFDPAHFETPAVQLRREFPRLDIRDITQSVTNLTAMGTALYDAIVYGALIVLEERSDDQDALRSHVLNAVAVHGPTGYRLVKGKESQKIDGAVSLAMAVMLANERGARDVEPRRPIYILGVDDDEDII